MKRMPAAGIDAWLAWCCLLFKWGGGDDVGEVFAAVTSHDVVVESRQRACMHARRARGSRHARAAFCPSVWHSTVLAGNLYGKYPKSGGKDLPSTMDFWRESCIKVETGFLAGKSHRERKKN